MIIEDMKMIADDIIAKEKEKELVKEQLIPAVKNMIIEYCFDTVKNYMIRQSKNLYNCETGNRKVEYFCKFANIYSYNQNVEDGYVTDYYTGVNSNLEEYFKYEPLLKPYGGNIWNVGMPTIKLIDYKCHQINFILWGKGIITSDGVEIIESVMKKLNKEGISTILLAEINSYGYGKKPVYKQIALSKEFKFIHRVNDFSKRPRINICLKCTAVF